MEKFGFIKRMWKTVASKLKHVQKQEAPKSETRHYAVMPRNKKIEGLHLKNNRRNTPGRCVQVIPYVKKKSHFFKRWDLVGGVWMETMQWVPDVVATKVIRHAK